MITPGAKLGLANIVTVVCLYTFTLRETFLVVVLRVIMATLLGGTLSSFFYSIAGGILSMLAMYFIKRLGDKNVSILGVSIVGSVFHNIGQILIAAAIIQNLNIVYYLPVLLIAGVGTGIFVGITAKFVLSQIKKLHFMSASK
jgi:heptaprenyl diphosphate synthase